MVLVMSGQRPTFTRERALLADGRRAVAGIDEAGRGPWAGPVVAAAVVLDASRIPRGLRDSKLLDPGERDDLYRRIVEGAAVGIGIADVGRIDRDNIYHATHWAMRQAVAALPSPPDIALVDGNRAPGLAVETTTIVGGDGLVASIAAASIVAKVTRDRMMIELAARFPAYGFERHKGYGTPQHQEAIRRHGVCAEHRRSFAPIRAALGMPAACTAEARERTA
jgi:ribonuclease HII